VSHNAGDFHAMEDVLNELADDSDSLSADEAMAAIEALGQLASVVKRTTSLVETALRRHLEAGGPRQLGGRAYVLKDAGKWRDNHLAFRKAIIDDACRPDTTTGELPTARDAATLAANAMFEAYLSQSSKIKESALEMYGFTRPQISTWEKTGSKIEVVDLGAPEGAT
jgi:hypothetical protein